MPIWYRLSPRYLRLSPAIYRLSSRYLQVFLCFFLCCREWCRNICLKIGLGPATLCLADLWVAITCAKVQLSDLNPEEIDESSMGVRHASQAPISDLRKLNPYEKVHYKDCLLVVEEMTSLLQPMEPDLICQVQCLARKVSEAIAEEA